MLSRCWWNFRCKKIGNAVFGLAKITDFDVSGSVYTVHSGLHDSRESDDEVLDDGVTMNDCMSSNNVDGLCEQSLMQKETEFGQGSDGRSRVSVVSFNGLMSDFCRMGCVDGAKSVLGVMLKYGLHPDTYSYNIMINGLCASGPMEEALGFADDMERNGVEPDTVIYNILLKGLQRLGLMSEAHPVIRQMMQKGLQSDLVACTTLICGDCQVGNIEEAVKLRDEMLSRGLHPTIDLYSVLLSSLCKIGQLNKVILLFDEMDAVGCFLCHSNKSHLQRKEMD